MEIKKPGGWQYFSAVFDKLVYGEGKTLPATGRLSTMM